MTRQRLVNQRTSILATLLVVIGVIFVGRLFYLQIIKHGYYSKLALAEQQKQFEIPATRGQIYFQDNGQPLPVVLNSQVYTLYADQTLIKDVDKTSQALQPLLSADVAKNIKSDLTIKNNHPDQYVVLAQHLSQSQADKILSQKLSGINVTAVPQRVYPEGTLGSQLLGFVNANGQGQYGVEGALNSQLEGRAGRLKAVTDVNGVPLASDPNNIAIQPQNGKDVVLTIDRSVQAAAERILAQGLKNANATQGSMIIIDPNTGAIKAMANLPTYNPAQYYDVQNAEVFQNRTVSAPYEPGSVMKIMTVAAGLDSGAIQPGSSYYNSGVVRVNDFDITNAVGDEDAVGQRNIMEILEHSLNTGAVWILQQMGNNDIDSKAKDTLYKYFTERFGFGTDTGIMEADEQPGYISKPDVSSQLRYANMAFGQGITVSMLQYVSAFSSVINGGKYYRPYLVDGYMNNLGQEVDISQPKVIRQTITPKSSEETTDLMVTARAKVPLLHDSDPSGYIVGGKSGTAQKVDAKTGKYYTTQTVGSYVGFAGNPKPKYVIMVRVDDSKTYNAAGSLAANPIFSTMNKWLINYYRMAPL